MQTATIPQMTPIQREGLAMLASGRDGALASTTVNRLCAWGLAARERYTWEHAGKVRRGTRIVITDAGRAALATHAAQCKCAPRAVDGIARHAEACPAY